MRKIKVKGTKGFKATATAEGTVILSIRGTTETEHFAFSAVNVPEIVTRIVAAHATSSLKEGRLSYAVVARRAVVAVDRHTNRVLLI